MLLAVSLIPMPGTFVLKVKMEGLDSNDDDGASKSTVLFPLNPVHRTATPRVAAGPNELPSVAGYGTRIGCVEVIV